MSAKPVFIVGNKRSGSTLLVNMLNEHPQLAITHESDIIWALYQCRNGVPLSFQPYPWDAPRGLDALGTAYGDSLRELLHPPRTPEKLRSAYFEIQRHVIELGTEVHVPLKSASELTWIGDKKPVQHASPELREFILDLFPDASFVHVIRHPSAVVASQQEAARTWRVVPEYWKRSAADVMNRWGIHEQRVLELKDLAPGRVQTVRLEDLSLNPGKEMSKLFAFLQLEAPLTLTERLAGFVYTSPNAKYSGADGPLTTDVQRIMEMYGYAT